MGGLLGGNSAAALAQFITAKEIEEISKDAFIDFLKWWKIYFKEEDQYQLYYIHNFNWVCNALDITYKPIFLHNKEIDYVRKSENMLYKNNFKYEVIYTGHHTYIKVIKNFSPIPKDLELAYLQDYIMWKSLVQIPHEFESKEEVTNKAKVNFIYGYLKRYLKELPGITSGLMGFSNYNNKFIVNDKEEHSRVYINNRFSDKLYYIFTDQSETNSSLSELKIILELLGDNQTIHTEEPYRYRGQADASWLLNSSLTRIDKFKENEKKMYYDVRNTLPKSFETDTSLFQELIRLQHYNLPTRLLDLTRNPLVALYFACCNSDKMNKDCVIFRLKPDKNEQEVLNFNDKQVECLAKRTLCVESTYPCDKCGMKSNCEHKGDDLFSKNWFVNGYLSNPRIDNQQGDFIFVNTDDLNDTYKFVDKIVVIEASLKKILLEKLESLNIHAGTLFPELSSISKYIQKKYNSQQE